MAQIPLPKPYQDTEEYWKAAKEHRFIIQKCGKQTNSVGTAANTCNKVVR